MLPTDADYITNMVTGKELPISFSEYVADTMLGDRGITFSTMKTTGI